MNMSENREDVKQIDLVQLWAAIKRQKKLYYIILPTTFIASCLLILCVPRFYKTTVKLAPELSSFSSNSLSDIASSFGFDIGKAAESSDAIFPELYPDLIASKDFQTELFKVKVKTLDGQINTSYYDYILSHQKAPFWSVIKYKIFALFESKPSTKNNRQNDVNAFMLTKQQDDVANSIGSKITCDVDKKTYVISITVEDQDPLVCANMADTVKDRLQQVITNYRTNKARTDYEYFNKLCIEAKTKYERARRLYASYSDANQDVVLQSFKSKQEDLENDMQLLYNRYTALATQMEQAQAKVQERTPAFTQLQKASVPLKPAGPKRMLFVLGMTFLAFALVSLYAMKDFFLVN